MVSAQAGARLRRAPSRLRRALRYVAPRAPDADDAGGAGLLGAEAASMRLLDPVEDGAAALSGRYNQKLWMSG